MYVFIFNNYLASIVLALPSAVYANHTQTVIEGKKSELTFVATIHITHIDQGKDRPSFSEITQWEMIKQLTQQNTNTVHN